MAPHIGLTTLMLIFTSLNHVSSEQYYISEEQCNSTDATYLYDPAPCVTISQFAANSLHSITNVILIFLPGRNYLTNNISVSNLTHLSMVSENATAQVECAGDYSVSFTNIQQVHITNLEFIGCGGNQMRNVTDFVIQDATFTGNGGSKTALELIRTRARIANVIFASNVRGKFKTFLVYRWGRSVSDWVGGGIIATNSNITINQSTFVSNRASYGGAIFAEEGSIININNSMFINNSAINNGGVLHSNFSSITIGTCDFNNNTARWYGGVVVAGYSSTVNSNNSNYNNNNAGSVGGVVHGSRGLFYSKQQQ